MTCQNTLSQIGAGSFHQEETHEPPLHRDRKVALSVNPIIDAGKHEPYASGRQPPSDGRPPRRRGPGPTIERLHEGKRAGRRVAVHLALDGNY